jgi:hypothetical protein
MVDYTTDEIFNLAMENQNPYNFFPYGSIDTGFSDLTSGQGNISNVRHAVGTALARDYITSLLDPFYESNKATGSDPWWGAKLAGNTGAWLTGVGEEIGDAYRSYKEGNPKWYVQPWEDVLANTMGLKEANYYTDANEKAKTMTKVYAEDKGIINAFLQKLSADNPNVLRQKDLQMGLVPGSGSVGQMPRYVNPHPHFVNRDMPIWRGGNPNWDQPYDDGPTWKEINSKENAIAGGAAGASAPSFIPQPVSSVSLSDVLHSQPLPPKGAAGFNTGGIVSLWHK